MAPTGEPVRLLQTSRMRDRVQLALEAIRRHFYAYGCPPSYRELGAAIGAQPSRVSAIVRELVEAGEIGHTPGARKSITLPRPLANYADSELLLELQHRGYVIQIGAAVKPLSIVAVEIAAEIQSGTIQQLPEI
jgi:hypothetical protein